MKKKIVSWLIILLMQFIWIPIYVWGPEQTQQEDVIEEEWDLIRWKQEE